MQLWRSSAYYAILKFLWPGPYVMQTSHGDSWNVSNDFWSYLESRRIWNHRRSYGQNLFRGFCFQDKCAVAKWLGMRTHNTGLVSSIPPCVTFKTPFVRKATGNHLMNSTSLDKTQSPVSGFRYARNWVNNAASKIFEPSSAKASSFIWLKFVSIGHSLITNLY